MKKKGIDKMKNRISSYFLTNRLFISYIIISVFFSVLFKHFTVSEGLSIRNFIPELSMIMILGSFCYLMKPKNQYNYLFGIIIFYTFLFSVNTIYYQFYTSFASFGELATLKQVETVTGSVWEKIRFVDLIYLSMPFIFRQIHIRLKMTSYYAYISKIEKGFSMFLKTLLVGLLLLGIRFVFATGTDYSSIKKQWNRAAVVKRFGIIIYQGNDLVQTLTPKFGSLFGYDDAVEVFKNFFNKYGTREDDKNNKYSNILKGMNVVFVHMEGQQTLLMNQEFNGQELTPYLNSLAKEGTMFNNFYPQISTGTSSDSEFTLLSSLMPAASGTIFVSYYDRNYITTPKLLSDNGYYTFSMHGNAATMWNRNKAHKSLGYQDMYFEDSYTYTEDDVINLGINDKLFFEQATSIIENIEQTYDNYMGTIITLSNHSPFSYLDKYGEFDLTKTFKVSDETGKVKTIESDYLEGTAVGNYFHSANYADEALGEFINYVNNSEYFNNTVFVFYGDHDVRLGKNNINMLYNYNPETGEYFEEGDDGYISFDSFDYELSKNTPLIIWTKNKSIQAKLPKEVNNVMGMYDVLPTLGNMMGFTNKYALGHDIFDINDNNIVVFPNGNFLTNYIYYNNSTGEYKILKDGVVLDENYIKERLEYVNDVLDVSNAIVVYDLLNDSHLSQIEESLTNEKK